MTSLFKQSPGRRRGCDLESGKSENFDSDSDTFSIPSKNASVERLQQWRKAALVLNASRRFRYTLDLKKEQETREMRQKIRGHAHALLAANRFMDMGREQGVEKPIASATPAGDFGIGPEQLVLMSKDHNISSLKQYEGAQGLSDLLNTNIDNGFGQVVAKSGYQHNHQGEEQINQHALFYKSLWLKAEADRCLMVYETSLSNPGS